jgi:hypothetical protein
MHDILAIREMNQSPSADAKQGLQLALDIWRNSAASSDAEERYGERRSVRVRTVGATRPAGSAIAGIKEARADGRQHTSAAASSSHGPIAGRNELTYPATAEVLFDWGVTVDLAEFEGGRHGCRRVERGWRRHSSCGLIFSARLRSRATKPGRSHSQMSAAGHLTTAGARHPQVARERGRWRRRRCGSGRDDLSGC